MSAEEFTRYLEYFIPDYAAEISRNYGVSASDGLARARREIAMELPEGPQTPGQALFSIVDDRYRDETIGYLWYCPDDKECSVFICDFYIVAEQRGTGQGRRALNALEAMLYAQGYNEIKLRVAADNARAQHVYRADGFRATGINMVKQLSGNGKAR